MRVLVTGATGPQGRAVVSHLLKHGHEVRALVRDPAKAHDLAVTGVDVVQGDLDDPASVAAAMKGQNGVFLTVGFFDGTYEQAKAVIDAAVDEGVQKIVWNVAGVVQDFDIGNPAVDKWRPILKALETCNVPYAVLEPTVYMENMLIPAITQEVAEGGVLAYPMPASVSCQWISHQDAAAYTVAAFENDEGDSYRLRVCGPEKVTGDDIAQRFAKVLGRPITFRQMSADEFAQAMGGGEGVEPIVGYYRAVAENPDMMSTDIDHKAALAKLPIRSLDFASWVDLYKGAFTKG